MDVKLLTFPVGEEVILLRKSDSFLYAGVSQESSPLNRVPLNRVPRNSVLVQMLVLQSLSVALQADVNLTPKEYIKRHPSGALGRLEENEM